MARTQLHHEVVIERPRSEVWDVLADLERVAEYNRSVLSARWLDNKHAGVGAGRVCQVAPRGETTEVVTAWEPGHALGLEMATTPWPPILRMSWVTRLESVGDDRTRVTQDLVYDVGWGIVGALLNSVALKRKLWQNLDAVFAALKNYVEHDAAAEEERRPTRK
jgi:uncharacterized protein YndB with AHSA1/START domain